MMLLLLTLTLHASERPELTTITRAEFCGLILSPDDTRSTDLTDTLVRQIGTQVGLEKVRSQFSYMADMRQVMHDLVQKGTISEAQANALFAEKTLGGYSRLFLKFTIAELLGRGFERNDIVHTVIHFDEAFLPDRQVKFALDVARRMLLTLNEDPGMSSPEGIRAFMAAVAAFKIEYDTYANFLRLWAFVRESDPRTIVQFILGNIKNAGHIMQEDVRDLLEQKSAARDLDPAKASASWLATLRGASRSSLVVPAAPDFESVAQEFLDIDTIPDWILRVAGLPQAADKQKSFLERFRQGSDASAKAYLTGLEKHPPFALEFIIRAQLPELSFATLDAFARTQIYKNLSENTRVIGDDLLTEFRELQRLEENLKTARDESSPRTSTLKSDLNPIRPKFMDLYLAQLADQDLQDPSTIPDILITAYEHAARNVGQRVDSQSFVELAVKTIDRTCAGNKLEVGAAAVRAVFIISHDFELSSDQLKEIFRIMASQRFFNSTGLGGPILMEMGSLSLFTPMLKVAGWGRAALTSPASAVSVVATPAIRAALVELKTFFARHHVYFDDLDALYRLFLAPPVKARDAELKSLRRQA